MPGSGNYVSDLVTNIAANGVSVNVLDGTGLETMEFPANVIVGLSHNGAVGSIRATFIVGGKTIVDDQVVPETARFPIAPDDFTINAGALAGENLQLRFRETAGGTTTDIFYTVKAQPVAV